MHAIPPTPPIAQVRRSRRVMIGGTLVAALGGLIFGFDTVAISGANEPLEALFKLDEIRQGFTVAIAIIGTIAGVLVIGESVRPVRPQERAIRFGGVLFRVVAWLRPVRNWPEFLLSRFIAGIAIGGALMVTPMYIAEISPPRLRGRLVMVNQLNIVVGVLLAYVSNYAIAQCFEFEVAWRWMFAMLALPSAVFFFLIFLVPESPRHLVKKGRPAEARNVLERLGDENVEGELAAIQASLADRPGHLQERLFGPPYWRFVFLACAMAAFNQLTGINAVLYYGPTIFRIAGALRDSSLLQSIAMGGTLLVFTVVAMFIIDRFGRRILLRIGSIGMAACMFARRRLLGRSERQWASGSRRADRLHRLLRHVARCGHVRLHLRSIPQRRSR